MPEIKKTMKNIILGILMLSVLNLGYIFLFIYRDTAYYDMKYYGILINHGIIIISCIRLLILFKKLDH